MTSQVCRWKREQRKPYLNRWRNTTSGWPAVDDRFICVLSPWTRSALRSWMLTNVPTTICICKPFSCKACPGKARISKILCKPMGEHNDRLTTSTSAVYHPSVWPTLTKTQDVSVKARTKEIPCKPVEEQNVRLTRGPSAVYHPDEKRPSFRDAH